MFGRKRGFSLARVIGSLVLGVVVFPVQPVLAQLEETKTIDIPAGPLGVTLRSIAEEFGVGLFVEQALVDNKQAGSVNGTYGAEEAFRTAVKSHGLVVRISGQGAFTILASNESAGSPTALSTAPTENTSIDEIVVSGFRRSNQNTATRVGAELFKTPTTLNTVTEDFLDTIVARRSEEALLYVPGVGVGTSQGGGRQEFNIRGFSNSGFGRGGTFFVNGYRGSPGFLLTDTANLERLDVFKGPASPLYGTNPPGGLVNYVTKKPKETETTSLDFSMGSFSGNQDLVRGVFDSTGPLTEKGDVLYRIVVSSQQARQSQRGDGVTSTSVDDRILISPSIRWFTPTGGTLDVEYEYFSVDQTYDPGIKFIDGQFTFDSEPFFGSGSPPHERTNHRVDITYTQPIGKTTELRFGGSFNRTDRTLLLDAVIFGPTDGALLPRFTRDIDDDFEQFQPRVELSTEWSPTDWMKHELLIGAEYYDFDQKVFLTTLITPDAIDPFNPAFTPISPNDAVSIRELGRKEYGFYVQDYVELGDRWSATVGLRYSDYEEQPDFGPKGEDDTFDWSLGVSYEVNDNVAPYIAASTSKRSLVAYLTDGSLAPAAEGEQIEVGVKSQWFNNRFSVNAAYYELEETGRTEPVPGSTFPFVNALLGTAASTGFEVEWSGLVLPGLEVFGGYSNVDAEISESSNPAVIGLGLTSVPDETFSLYAQYSFNQKDGLSAFEGDGWSAGLGILSISDRPGDTANSFELPSYTRVDANVQLRRGNYRARLSIENLTDETYVIGSENAQFITQGPPRFVILSFGIDF